MIVLNSSEHHKLMSSENESPMFMNSLSIPKSNQKT